MKKTEEKYVRVGDKLFIANGIDPLSYINLAHKWWQFWKPVRKHYKPKTSFIYKYKVMKP